MVFAHMWELSLASLFKKIPFAQAFHNFSVIDTESVTLYSI